MTAWLKSSSSGVTVLRGSPGPACPPASRRSWTLPSQILTRPWCRERLEETTSDGGTWSEGEKEKSLHIKPYQSLLVSPCEHTESQQYDCEHWRGSAGLILYRASGGRLRTPGKGPWATQLVQSARPALSPVSAPSPGSGGGSVAAGRPEGPTASGPCSPPAPAPACRPSHSQSCGCPRRASWGCVWERKA